MAFSAYGWTYDVGYGHQTNVVTLEAVNTLLEASVKGEAYKAEVLALSSEELGREFRNWRSILGTTEIEMVEVKLVPVSVDGAILFEPKIVVVTEYQYYPRGARG